MPGREIIQRTIGAGREVGQRSQDRVEVIVAQLQRMSEDQLDQVMVLLGEVRDRSVVSRDQLVASGGQVVGAIERQVRSQLDQVGLATKADLARLERKVDALSGKVKDSATTKKSAGAKAASKPAKKAAGKAKKKSPAKPRKSAASSRAAGGTKATRAN
jgi:hypothetical protein